VKEQGEEQEEQRYVCMSSQRRHDASIRKSAMDRENATRDAIGVAFEKK
jgi:hypothetical protein